MKKMFVALLVLAIMSTIVNVGYAAEEKGGGNKGEAVADVNNAPQGGGGNKGEASNDEKRFSESSKNNKEGQEYLIEAWGRYGPIYLPSGYSNWWRINYPGCFLGTPSVHVSLEVPYPWTQKYSIGVDKGYSFACRFDARVTSISGALTGSMINWHAKR